jgi:hypothetical protein
VEAGAAGGGVRDDKVAGVLEGDGEVLLLVVSRLGVPDSGSGGVGEDQLAVAAEQDPGEASVHR